MGYEVHITRAENWASNQDQEIATQEWLDVVRGDPELIPAPENGEYFVVWRGTTKYPETWFDWFGGDITTKNPDKATLRKMLKIATCLRATVQGDEGEIYDEASVNSFDDSYLDSNSSDATTKLAHSQQPSFVQKLFGRKK
ncbi:MAG: hypothetical protein HY872_02795 [Chloroflexi bacterium]|nr:hypothetical protein [Chloroflexota bacterium]